MAKKKKHPEHANHERWLVSYADFITLLFAFFTVLYATSKADPKKTQVFVGAVQKAFELGIFDPGGDPLSVKGSAAGASTERLMDLGISVAELEKRLDTMAEEASITPNPNVKQTPEGVVVTLSMLSFFRAGSDEIKPAAMQTLKALSEELNKNEAPLRVEGHTDSSFFHTRRFDSNWELSLARAMAVARVLMADGVQGSRLGVGGYGANRPVAPNNTPDGRAKNRRVEVVIENKRIDPAPVTARPSLLPETLVNPLSDELSKQFAAPAISAQNLPHGKGEKPS